MALLASLRMSRVDHRDLERSSHPYQLGEGFGSHFLHDLAAMNLDSDLANAQLRCGLFVEQATHHQRQHLALQNLVETQRSAGEAEAGAWWRRRATPV